jgi:hypothetical protein
MNKRQWTALLVGAGIIAVIALFPPWKFVYGATHSEMPAPYGFFYFPPGIPAHLNSGLGRGPWVARVDWYRLVLPMVVVAACSYTLILAFRTRDPSKK